MSEGHTTDGDFAEIKPAISAFRRVVRVFLGRKVVVLGLIVILILIITALFAPLLAPYPYDKMELRDKLLQPSWEHPLGTDSLGRDTLSRLIYGARTSLLIGLVATGASAAIGMTLGLIAGYFGGIIQAIIMRCTDALMSFPTILTAVVLGSILGSGLRNVLIAISVCLMPVYIRLMCGQVLAVKEIDYVTAARATGASNLRIMLRHVVPNCFPPLIVAATLQIGLAIMVEAALSFLGVGIEPPGAAWGAMVSDGYQHLLKLPILSFAPGLAIMIVVLSLNMVGDGLRDALDPRLRGAL